MPQVIDDYNHWMLGVDKADQFIAYYRAKIRCRQTWMPIIMLNSLDIHCVNACILHEQVCRKEEEDEENKGHKWFLINFMQSFIRRAGDHNN
jgi:hypothetical protein